MDPNATGGDRRRAAQGVKSAKIQEALVGLDPQVASWVDDFVFGAVWARPGLEFDDRLLVAIAMLAAGRHPDQLRVYLYGALQAGVPAMKIREVLVMLVVYAGFPAALQALTLFQEVLASSDPVGTHPATPGPQPAAVDG